MNEELKIIIKAVTTEANKSLDGVKDKLNAIKNTSDKSGKSVAVSMQSLAKGAAIAAAAVTAVTTAMVALGKSSLEFQREQAKLNTAFQAMGSSADQAAQTYKELYRFLGDVGQATEAAQSLSKITTSQKELAEWTEILQGVYASFGSSLPVESLAEAANETIKVGQVTGAMADALNWLGVSEDAVNEKLQATTSLQEREVLLRSILNNLYSGAAASYEQNNQALIKYNESQVELDYALAEATRYVVPLMTALNQLAATLLSVLRPAFENIAAVIVAFVQWVMAAIKAVGAFFGIFSDTGASSTDAIADTMGSISNSTTNVASGVNKLGDSFNKATKEAEKLKKQTMGFDELNVVSPQKSAASATPGSGAGAGAGAIAIPEISIPKIDMSNVKLPDLGDFEDKVEKVKKYLEPISVLVGIIAAGIATWNLINFINDLKTVDGKMASFKTTLKNIGAEILIMAGAMATFYGYSDAWVNGVDWGNLAITLGGLAATITGIGLAYGTLAASIAVVAAGVALMVLGVQDFINQGPTVENTILIIGGAIAVAVGLATAGLSVVVAAIVAAVAAVAAFTAAILLEKPAIMSVAEAQEALTAAKERAAEAENSYINAVDAAEASMKRLEEAEKAAGMTGEELYKQVQAGTLDYANMNDAQKELYKAYLDNEKKQKDLKAATEELSAAKKAETIASFENQLAIAKESGNYDDFKKSVIAAYEEGSLSADEARDLIAKSMSEMSDASQQTFMEDIPGDLKEGLDPHQYESTGTKISKWFQNVGKTIGTWFSESLWKPIKDWWNSKVKPIFTAKWWKDKFNQAKEGVKGAFNGIIDVVERAINFIIRKINTLSWEVPDWVPVIGGSRFGFNFREIRIPRLAEGGIVNDSILANIGERGREAVLPLENNTEWMDILAARIAERSATPTKVVLQVGEKELGWATIGAINGITKQTGGLQLAL